MTGEQTRPVEPTHDDEQLAPATSRTQPFVTELAFTDTYRRYRDASPATREAQCLRVQYPDILAAIEEGDLLAGRLQPRLVGFSPDEWGSCAFGYYHLPASIKESLQRVDLDSTRREQVEEMLAFWDRESTSAKLRAAYSPKMARYLPSDDWMGTCGIAFPLYRLTGATLDYGKLLRLGLPGLTGEVQQRRARARAQGEPTDLLDAMLVALDVLGDAACHYENQARVQARYAADERRCELTMVADTLASLRDEPPQTFHAALQLFWLYSIVADVRNHGRLDVGLGSFLARDLDAGRLTEEAALRLMQSLWRLMAARRTRVHNRVIVGGRGRRNEADADRFALLAMEATRTVREIEPQLSLRFYEGQHPALMQKALDVIGEGRTFPMLYNDDVNIPAVQQAFGVERDEAEQYVPYGCGEYVLEHRSLGTPSGVINLLKALEVTLHDGVDPLTDTPMGLALGAFRDFGGFEELWCGYTRQVEHYVEIMADQQALEYEVAGQEAAFLYLSMLYDDCIERGRALLDGGIRYLGGTLETYGNTNVADSLTAIKHLVYDTGRVTPDELLAALDANFQGHPHMRRLLQRVPKYGNDDDQADAMLLRVHEHVCRYTRQRGERTPLHSYLVVVINNGANTLMGRWTAASADGRRAGAPMNNGNAPSSGADSKGVTALLNSLVKPSPAIHAGAVQNLKFSPVLFTRHRAELEALLQTYFDLGGAQAMITVVSRGDLERAMEEPENYRHLFVRVGGFSARFVTLPWDIQREILERTLY